MENKLTDVDDLKRCFFPRQVQQYTGTSDFQSGYSYKAIPTKDHSSYKAKKKQQKNPDALR